MTAFTLDHVMMRVGDLDASLDWYGDHMGYVEHARWEADTFTNVYIGPEDPADDAALLELTYNHDTADYDNGDAFGHIAVRVDDVSDAYEELLAGGVADYRDPESCGGSYAFVKDPDGHEIELVAGDAGQRWSIDHTMVRVADATQHLGFWTRVFGYEHTGRWEADSFANYFMKPPAASDAAMAVELTYNYDDRTYTFGDGWGHLAVRADSLQDDWATLLERETADYRDPASCDMNYAFTKTPDGHEIEVLNPESSPMDRSA
ncbi:MULTISPECIES: VOC family protein [Halobacterium]|uniref:Glyoxalase n=4 Tax=Halobacterium salinarum TaxID=2242 RepID=Q9HQK8_HALSA|nr:MULTISPECIES: VOC family protein [Halobacterium]AAG19505.1 glyoxalase [Halobacterium salinarum NRC-1]MBB6090190.1 lactoylglutathione lyase [Halobacterium salinarum]MCF2165013.1 VOC family protein [Halobacterium salinarum]MCF2168650.1 VOC family protein [Halobacterium salinarum]MCF2208142.1 VOC family protein [Halobacterium salinarum]